MTERCNDCPFFELHSELPHRAFCTHEQAPDRAHFYGGKPRLPIGGRTSTKWRFRVPRWCPLRAEGDGDE